MDSISISKAGDRAIINMDRGKVNAINHKMVLELRDGLKGLGADKQVRGIIIAGKPHFFSAGLDLIELFEFDLEQIKVFWKDFLGLMVDLIKFPKPVIAAITGHSPGGGAVIAVGCDYRIMAEGDYRIGLNEVSVGVTITQGIFHSYRFWLGEREAYHALLRGRLFQVDEALKVGLIDEKRPMEEVLSAADQKLSQLLRAPDYVLQDTKQVMRREWVAAVDVDMSREIEQRSVYWMQPESRKKIGEYIAGFTGKKK